MPVNSILICYTNNNSFLPVSAGYFVLVVKCTGSASSKKITFECTRIAGAEDGIYRARYDASAGTQWTGWKLLVTSTQIADAIKVVTGSKQYTVPAGGGIAVTSIPRTIPSGYNVVGVIAFYTGSDNVFPLRITHNRMDVHNVSSQSITATATISVLCAKTIIKSS